MGTKYLIDSNVLIEYVGNLFPEPIQSSLSAILDDSFTISFINKIEILGYHSVDEAWRAFVNQASIIAPDEDIIEQTIQLRIQHKIKIPDAIIAATALVNELTLLTRNVADFKKVSNLKEQNPWSWNAAPDIS